MVQMNLFAKQKERHKCRGQRCGYEGAKGGRGNEKTGIDIYTVVCIKQITNENPGNSTQCPVVT